MGHVGGGVDDGRCAHVGALALVLPQLLVGYGLAYLCIRMGLSGSMLAHAAFNGFALGLASLLE